MRATAAAPARPARCADCGGLSYLSIAGYLLVYVGTYMVMLGGVIASFALRSPWAVAVVVPGLAAVWAMGACFPMRATTPDATHRAELRAARLVKLALAVCAALLLYQLLVA